LQRGRKPLRKSLTENSKAANRKLELMCANVIKFPVTNEQYTPENEISFPITDDATDEITHFQSPLEGIYFFLQHGLAIK